MNPQQWLKYAEEGATGENEDWSDGGGGGSWQSEWSFPPQYKSRRAGSDNNIIGCFMLSAFGPFFGRSKSLQNLECQNWTIINNF